MTLRPYLSQVDNVRKVERCLADAVRILKQQTQATPVLVGDTIVPMQSKILSSFRSIDFHIQNNLTKFKHQESAIHLNVGKSTTCRFSPHIVQFRCRSHYECPCFRIGHFQAALFKEVCKRLQSHTYLVRFLAMDGQARSWLLDMTWRMCCTCAVVFMCGFLKFPGEWRQIQGVSTLVEQI